MKKSLTIVCAGIMVLFFAGCATVDPSLTAAERNQIKDLLYSARMAERFSDYETAIVSYQKIASSFPDRPYAKVASKRVKKLKRKAITPPKF